MGLTEHGKVEKIVTIFEDAYKSNLSLIILDEIERMIEYTSIGPRFSQLILQALLILIKKNPSEPHRKIMIIGTTSNKHVLDSLDLVDCFNVSYEVEGIKTKEDVVSILQNFDVKNDVAE